MPSPRTFSAALLCALLLVAPLAAAEHYLGYLRLVNGPVLGAVGPDHALVWVRGSYSFTVQIEYADNPAFTDAAQSAPVQLSKAADYCATIRLDGLRPDSRYHYRVLVNGAPERYLGQQQPWSFKTAPAAGFNGSFRVAFGSCARYQYDRVQRIWEVLPRFNPDLFFWIGDNIYGDSLDPDILADEFRRQRDIPNLVELMRELPQLAIWDDHDFGLNDYDRRHPRKAEALAVFTRYWPNPAAGTADTPGVFFHYRYGGVDFFFLDNRYHRDPNDQPDGPDKTHLGAAQLAWLQDGLRNSDAPFKVLIAGGPWSDNKGPTGDGWSAFLHERNRLFDFIRDEAISGVVLVSGDTHVAELNCIPWSDHGGYDLYDLVSSPLAQRPSMGWMGRRLESRVRVPFAQGPNFGIIDFDLGADPKLSFNVVGEDGRYVWAPFELYAHELVNGVSSWQAKADPAVRRFMRMQESGIRR
jgi:alkaline phosphatase D